MGKVTEAGELMRAYRFGPRTTATTPPADRIQLQLITPFAAFRQPLGSLAKYRLQ